MCEDVEAGGCFVLGAAVLAVDGGADDVDATELQAEATNGRRPALMIAEINVEAAVFSWMKLPSGR